MKKPIEFPKIALFSSFNSLLKKSIAGHYEEMSVLSSSIIKICHHPDLVLLSKFERLLLTFSRWSYYWAFMMIKSQKWNCLKKINILNENINDWVLLNMDHIESGYVETLALIGKGL